MALVFDGNGVVDLPNWQVFGDFTITGTCTYVNVTQIVLGYNLAAGPFIACFNDGTFRAYIGNTSLSLSGFTNGDELVFSLTRVSGALTWTVNGSSIGGTNTSVVNFDSLGQFNGGALIYTGELRDDLVLSAPDGGDRSYNFDQPSASLVLPDSTSSQDGTLTGFTTGGFDGAGQTESVVITSVSDYQCLQRDGSGEAVFTIAGTCAGATTIEYSYDEITWAELDAAPTTTFTGDVTITGQQNLTVRLSNSTGITNTVYYLSAAAVIVGWWQSNMQGFLIMT